MNRRSLLSWLSLSLFLFAFAAVLPAQDSGELRFGLRADPKTFNPLLMADEPSETVSYLTHGVLLRVNRATQQLQPELATSWKISDGGRKITFTLRPGVSFSDGSPFTAGDVVYTFTAMMDPKLHSPIADSFQFEAGPTVARANGKYEVTISFPAPVAGLERLFDQAPILSASAAAANREQDGASSVFSPGLGPFMVGEYRAGNFILLRRNPRYWKHDAEGKQLPYLDAIRLEIIPNRDLEMIRFRQGELHLINNLDADSFERLAAEGGAGLDLGPSLEGEQMWFNQVAAAPLAEYKKEWFRSSNFRRAVSAAINRHDLARVVYQNHASPGVGPFSSANRFWFNSKLKAHPYDPADALHRLQLDGFRKVGADLQDRGGHLVEFSIITNAGNQSRERVAAMLQQDLKQIGIRLNVVTLDFPSIIERITHSFAYEGCLLGLVNVDLDPSAQMNVWMSSGENHQWNPAQKTPATPWEAEMDQLMRKQATELDPARRKAAFDRVQEIVSEQAPLLYLVNKNALVAVSPALRNVQPSVLHPQVYWNAESLMLVAPGNAAKQLAMRMVK
jgi:peptide/nickel transport system substrate-binding protein